MIIRSLLTALWLLLSLGVTAEASKFESRELSIADIPACGIKCLFLSVPKSNCRLDDYDCICNHHELIQAVSSCMVSNCTMAENLETARVNKQLCHLSEESQSQTVFNYSTIVYVLAFTFVAMRMAGKYMSNKFAWNDVPVLIAILLAAIPISMVIVMTTMGFGEHLWNLEDDRLLPILRYFYICRSSYIVILGLIKVSLVLFYLEIFTTKRFKRLSWLLFGYIVVNSIMIFLLTVFACTPVQAFWNRDLLLGNGKCMDIQVVSYTNSVSSIFQDFLLMILPVFFIKDLHMKRHRKLALVSMFSLGGFGCITTIIRLHTLLKFKISFDPTWDYVSIVIWTELEITACFLCVSLPSIRVLVMKLAPKICPNWNPRATLISRMKSNKEPSVRPSTMSPPPGQWEKPVTWTTITSAGDMEKTKIKRSNSTMSRAPIIPRSQYCHIKGKSRDLESPDEVRITVPESRYAAKDTKRYLHRQSRNSRGGYDGAHITALPSIGILPERTFSHEHLSNRK